MFVRTARPAVTWLRAPGMLQADLGIETVIDHGLRQLNVNRVDAKFLNLAKPGFVSMMGDVEETDRARKCYEIAKR